MESEEPIKPKATPPPLPAVPSLPPVIDEADDSTQGSTEPLYEQELTLPVDRLHPVTLVIAFWNAIRGFLIPILIIFVLNRSREGGSGIVFFLMFFFVMTLLQQVVRYFTFTFWMEGGELVTKQGLLARQERNIPLGRVQDIRLEQGIVHRLFGVADLHVETAGGAGVEASFSVLKLEVANLLREAVFDAEAKAKRAEKGITEEEAAEEEVEEETIEIRRLSTVELIQAGLTSNQTASTMALVVAALAFLDDFIPTDFFRRIESEFKNNVDRIVNAGSSVDWWNLAAMGGGVILIGLVISVVGALILFHGFVLGRKGEDLQRSYGLFTRRSSSLPRRRIQVLRADETVLRRIFGLVTLRADTAGGNPMDKQAQNEGRNVLLPVLPKRVMESVLPEFFPDIMRGAPEWCRVSRRAIRRGTVKGSWILVLASVALYFLKGGIESLWPLLLLPLVYVINVLNYRHFGYVLGDRYLRTRRGWLGRTTHVIPIRNIQSVAVVRTPFDRFHNLATLVVDTAGQAFTGGGPRIGNLPTEEAEMLANELTQKAAQMRYRWN